MKAKTARQAHRTVAHAKRPVPEPPPPPPLAPRWPYWLAAVGAVLLGFWVYQPALHGAFLFDDATLPFALPSASAPFMDWIRFSASRPVLYATYWMNSRMSGDDPFSFHVFNVIFHLIATGFVFLIVRRFVEWTWPQSTSARRHLLAGFAAAVFLLHPVQTEAVAYLAGRSDSLSVMLLLGAFTVFLYRPRREISWPVVAAVLILFGAALLSKQHTIALPALLLLTDYWWNPGFSWKGVRANWKLYSVMAAGAVLAVAKYWGLIISSPSAGFGMKSLTWYQYFFTQCRALFVYLGQFLLPVHLDVDWDFPISRTIFDRGAIFGLVALIALVALAWRYRRRFPLATYGFLAYLLLMAPTSSILPIADPVADRRLYISMIGLLLIVVDLLARVPVAPKQLATACAIVLLACAWATRAHAAIWSNPVTLWQNTVLKSPNKRRVHFQLASSYYDAGRCDLAIPEYRRTAELEPPNYDLLIDWALAYDQCNQPDESLAKLKEAAKLDATAHVYSQIGMVYAKQSRWNEALDALAMAQKIDPNFAMTYYYRGGVHLAQNQLIEAIANFRKAVQLDATYQPALQALATAEARFRAARR
jgi:tetratricopeptide (TPR) repeat protein